MLDKFKTYNSPPTADRRTVLSVVSWRGGSSLGREYCLEFCSVPIKALLSLSICVLLRSDQYFACFRIHVMMSDIRESGHTTKLVSSCQDFLLLGPKKLVPLLCTHFYPCTLILVATSQVPTHLKKSSSLMARITTEGWTGEHWMFLSTVVARLLASCWHGLKRWAVNKGSAVHAPHNFFSIHV